MISLSVSSGYVTIQRLLFLRYFLSESLKISEMSIALSKSASLFSKFSFDELKESDIVLLFEPLSLSFIIFSLVSISFPSSSSKSNIFYMIYFIINFI